MDSKRLIDHRKWFAVSVYGRQEKAALHELEAVGFDVYLPLRRIRRCWSDRVKELHVALFPGYLFVWMHLDAASRVRLLRPRQVIDLVGRRKDDCGIIAQHVPDCQIESLRLLVNSQCEVEPINCLTRGTEVRILQGPFKGAIGIVEREPSGKRRIVVQIPLLGRGVRAELSADDLLSTAELAA